MLDKIKLTSRNALIYSLGNISIKLVGLILIPIYTDPAYLSLNDYGILALLESTSQVIVAVVGMALVQALTRWYWEETYIEKQRSLFFTMMVFLVAISVIAIFAFNPFAGPVSILLFKADHFQFLLRLMFVSSCLQSIGIVPLTLLKLQSRPALYSVSSIVKLVMTLFLTMFLVVFKHRGLEGIYIAQVVGGVIFLVILMGYIVKNIQLKLELLILKEMIIYSLPLVLGSISGILLSIFDRYTLNYLARLQDVGVYALGFKIANTIKILVVNSVQLSVSPLIFQMMDKPESNRFYSKYMTYFSWIVMICVIGLSLFGLEILKVFTSSTIYWDAYLIIPIISFSVFFGMMKDTSLIGLQIMKKTRIIGTVILIVVIINLGLNILLIPYFGIYGAAGASLFSQGLNFFIIIRYAQKIYRIQYEFRKIGWMALSGLMLIIAGLGLTNVVWYIRVPVKIFLLGSFPFILYVINFYEAVEIGRIRALLKKWNTPSEWGENLRDLLKS